MIRPATAPAERIGTAVELISGIAGQSDELKREVDAFLARNRAA